jgi:RNA polymerase sigma factor (sigma-70 family)
MSVSELQAMAASQPAEQPAAEGGRPAAFPTVRGRKRRGPKLTQEETTGSSAVKGSLPKDPNMRAMISAAAKARGVPEEALYALVEQESSYNPNALNATTKAKGLLQYIPSSAEARKLDPSDPIASLAWGAKDFKEAYEAGGLDWAIKHHFAGPNTAGHGPKTRQYLADVKKRMADIRAQLDLEANGGEPVPGNVVAGGSDVPADMPGPTGVKTMSIADLQAMASGKPAGPARINTGPVIDPNENDERPVEPGVLDVIGGTLKEVWDQYPREYSRIWRKTKQRFFTDENKEEVAMTWGQIQDASKGMNPGDAKKVQEALRTVFPALGPAGSRGITPTEFRATLQRPSKEDVAENEAELIHQANVAKAEKEERGFIEDFMRKVDHPTKLVLRDSLPSTFIQGFLNHPAIAYDKMQEVKEIQQQYAVVNNPSAYSSEQVVAAQQAIAERKKLADNPESVGDILRKIKEAAARNPGGMAADFWNAFAKDPEMAFIPGGIGIKPVSAIERAVKAGQVAKGAGAAATTAARATPAATTTAASAAGGSVVSRAARAADAVIDPAATGGLLTTAIEESAAFSEGRETTTDEKLTTALMGAAPGALFGVLGIPGALKHGADARAKISGKTYEDVLASVNGDKKAAAATMEEALASIAPADAMAAKIITDPAWWNRLDLSPQMRASIEDLLQIRNVPQAERIKLYQARQRELEGVFQDEAATADYWRHYGNSKAAIRELESAASARAEHAATAEAEHFGPQREARLAEFQRNYDEALAARERARQLGEEETWNAYEDLKEATAKLDEEEIYMASLEGAPAVKRAMNNAARRDSQLRMPKWQRGEVNPEMLATLGVGSLFAGTAFALSEPEQKIQNAFLAGLAAIALPKGGNLGTKLRQAGAVSADGSIGALERMVRKTGLVPDRTKAEAIARDAELVEFAKQGRQDAINTLFEENYPGLVKHARRYTKGSTADAEDIVQEAFARVLSAPKGELPAIHKFSPNEMFSTWMKKVVENKALDSIEAAATQKRGGDVQTESLNRPTYDKFGEETTADVLDEGAGADFDTPEFQAMRADYRRITADVVKKLPEDHQFVYLMNKGEGKTFAQISEATGIPPGSIGSIIARTDEKILQSLRARFSGEDVPKGGIKGPKSQRGAADPKTLAKVAIAGGAGLGAAYVADRMNRGAKRKDDKEWGDRGYKSPLIAGLTTTGLMALLATSKGRRGAWQRTKVPLGKSATETVVKGNVVPISTELFFKAAPVFKAFQNYEMRVKQRVHSMTEKATPFIKEMRRMTEEGRNAFGRALFTGDSRVTNAMVEAFNSPKLTEAVKSVRSILDTLGDELKARKMIPQESKFEHFPRMVKDYPGLIKAIGTKQAERLQAVLDDANAESVRTTGHPLSDVVRDRIINQELFGTGAVDPLQPGYTKARVIEEITPELMQYYHTPEDSLLTYINKAVEDIERMDAFGKYAEKTNKKGLEFLDTAKSIDKMVEGLVKEGKMKPEHAEEVADLLRSRFEGGEVAEADWITRIKDIGNATYLGNLWSAGANLSDIIVQGLYVQGMVPTLKAIARQATGRKLISTKDLGLTHISAEFSTQAATTKWANRWLKLNLFSFFDAVGKNTTLNAALIKGRNLAQTEKGVAQIANRYQEIFGDDFSKLVTDLKTGKRTDATDLYSWMEISRTQPVSKLEMTQNYLNNPNLRTFWWMKSFAVKQLDLVHRDARLEMRKGTPAGIAKGSKNLIHAGIALGLSGASLKFVQQWMLTGKPPETGWEDIPLNMFRNMGISEIALKQAWGKSKEEAAAERKAGDKKARAREAKPVEAVISQVAPPYRIFQDAIVGKPQVVHRAIPWMSKWVLEQSRQAEEELRKKEKK